MRENRPYGSEGGKAKSLPDPYRMGTFARGERGFAKGYLDSLASSFAGVFAGATMP